MGKPFAQELQRISDTYNWALQVEINLSNEYLSKIKNAPSFVVGSGGSLSACYFLSMLQQKAGYISKSITPLDLYYAKESIPSSNVFFISASGKNSDILFAHALSVTLEARNIFSVCMKKGSPLSKQAEKYSISKMLEFELPSGKDGFLATNSLIAYFVILQRLFDTSQSSIKLRNISSTQQSHIAEFSKSLHKHFSITILYSGWGLPVAIDLESKFIEAGLGNINIADIRNFAHGRHNWFDKKKEESAIVALITPDNKEITQKTLSLLPKRIPILKLVSPHTDSHSSIELLVQSFHLVQNIGNTVSIDPGRPGVPSYGSKLYNLKYSNLFLKEFQKNKEKDFLPIIRKVGYSDYLLISKEEKEFWKNSLKKFKGKLQQTRFGGIIFDYDGTLCNSENRYNPPDKDIQNKLINILKNNAIVGVATGRGQSVRKDLQTFIPKELQNRVIIGYYNCSQIGVLTNHFLPQKDNNDSLLKQVEYVIKSNYSVYSSIDMELKSKQIEIKIKNKLRSNSLKRYIFDLLITKFFGKIKILESSHSLDIITAEVSKKNIIDECKLLAQELNIPTDFLCIGDKGKWPGNDYNLLSGDYSLSVDEVSTDAASCWNIAGVGIRNSAATLEYLDQITIKNGIVQINLKS